MERIYPVYVDTNILGLGLYAARDLEKGTVVAIADFEQTDTKYIANHPADEHKYVGVMGLTAQGMPIFGKVRGLWKYCNHSCDPNCDMNDTWEVVTNRKVAKGQELTTPYDAFLEGFPWPDYWNFECLCNAANCRKIINSYRLDIVWPVKIPTGDL